MRIKQITRRAFIVLPVTMIIMLGVTYSNDEQTQRRNADEALRNVGNVQTEEAIPGPPGSPGPSPTAYRYEEGIAGFAKFEPGATGRNWPINPLEFPEYTDYEGQQATRSFSLSAAGDGDRCNTDDGNRSDNLYDTVGIKFKVTQYTAGYESTGKRTGDPAYGITYSGAKVKENHTIAADPDVLPIGTVIQIEGLDGTYVVEDTGSAVKGKHIDIYTPKLADAREWGVQYRRIIILEEGLAELGP